MKKSIYILASLFMLLLSSPIFAQADPGADPEPPVAPIDDYVWILAAIAIALVFVFFKIRAFTFQGNAPKE